MYQSHPHLPQQPGAMYFKSGYNVNIFGVCRTDGGENIQLNYLVGDDEFPQGVSKGSNTTLNLVYHALNKLARVGKEKLQITCDNCGAQNKNNLSLWFWAWLIMKGWYKEICVNFMIPDHNKISVMDTLEILNKSINMQKLILLKILKIL